MLRDAPNPRGVLPRQLHSARAEGITRPGMPRAVMFTRTAEPSAVLRRNVARADLARLFHEIDASRAVHEWMRAKYDGRDSKIKTIAADYGWSVDKAKQVHAGGYRIAADDVFRVVAVDGWPALLFLFSGLVGSPLSGFAAREDEGEAAARGPGSSTRPGNHMPHRRGEELTGAGLMRAMAISAHENLLAAASQLGDALAVLAAGQEFGEAGFARAPTGACDAVTHHHAASPEPSVCGGSDE